MNWTYHLTEDERHRIEDKAPHQFAALVRKALWQGMMHHVNEDRKRQGLMPVRRPPGGHESDWERKLNAAIESVVIQIDARTGNYGSHGVAWVDAQFARLRGMFRG